MQTDAPAQKKMCTQCGKTKILSEFHKDPTKRLGVNSRCKECYLSARRALDNNNRMRRAKCVADGCFERPVIYRRCETHAREFRATGKDVSPPRSRRVRGSAAVRDDFGRKRCSRCGLWLDESEFTKASEGSRASDGLQSFCRSCGNAASRKSREKYPSEIREYRLQKQHGLTQDEFTQLLLSQDGKCAGCGTDSPSRWVIDHDHNRGCPEKNHSCSKCRRGILCDLCNTTLGLFADNADTLRRLAEYLDSHSQN